MSNPGASRPNIFLIGLLAVAVGGASLFFVLRKPSQSPAPGQPVATAPAPVTPPVKAKTMLTIPSFEWPGQVLSAKLSGLNITNSSLPREEIEALLKGGSPAAMADTLAKLNADEFSIASIEVTSTIEGQKSTTIYENITGKNIVAGKLVNLAIAETRQAGVTLDAEKKPISYTMKTGVSSLESLDLVTALRWLVEADPAGNAPFKPIHGAYAISKIEFSVLGFQAEIGRTTLSGFKVKPPRRAMSAMWPAFEQLMKAQNADNPELSAEMIANFLDIYSSFEMGELRMGAITGSGKTEAGAETSFKMGGMRLSGGAKANGAIDPIEVTMKDGTFRLGNMSWQGDFYQLLFVALGKLTLESDEIAAQPEAEVARLKAELARQPIPDTALKLSGLDVDVQQKDKPSERVKFSLAGFETRNAAFVGTTPTNIGLKFTNFRMPIPANTKDGTLLKMRAMGLETLDFSFNLDGVWDEAKSTVTFKDISSVVENLGSLVMSFNLGNVPKSLFENPTENWNQALLAGTIHQMSLSLANRGGFEKLIATIAAEQGKKPEQLRLEVSAMTPAVLAMFLANHPDAVALTDAVSGFLRGLGELSIKARAEGAEGLRLLELAGAGANPAVLLKKLRFEASGK